MHLSQLRGPRWCLDGFVSTCHKEGSWLDLYGSFMSSTFAAHHQQDGAIMMFQVMEHVACQAKAKRRVEEKRKPRSNTGEAPFARLFFVTL